MDIDSVRRAYKRWAPVYDMIFGPVARLGRLRTVRAANALGAARILEVGVGTGLSLPHYRADSQIVGIDLSDEMLAVARQRIAARQLSNVELHAMDAEDLSFADGSFDIVVAMYVMSVVPHPDRALAEMRRVCKPGGAILICNHFVDDAKHRRGLTRRMAPMARWLGWRPDFALSQVKGSDQLEVVSADPVPPLFTVMCCRNRPARRLGAAE